MLCNICHKNEAIVHFKGILNDQVFEIDLCEECAHQKGMEFKKDIQLTDFISSLVDLGLPQGSGKKKVSACPVCGLTYAEFKHAGRLGCSNCYTVFEDYLQPLLERIHGSVKHTGRSPKQKVCAAKPQDIRKQKSTLKKELQALKLLS